MSNHLAETKETEENPKATKINLSKEEAKNALGNIYSDMKALVTDPEATMLGLNHENRLIESGIIMALAIIIKFISIKIQNMALYGSVYGTYAGSRKIPVFKFLMGEIVTAALFLASIIVVYVILTNLTKKFELNQVPKVVTWFSYGLVFMAFGDLITMFAEISNIFFIAAISEVSVVLGIMTVGVGVLTSTRGSVRLKEFIGMTALLYYLYMVCRYLS